MCFTCGSDYPLLWSDVCVRTVLYRSLTHVLYVTAVHVEDIIFHMFQYIQKLRTEGPQEWVFEECKVINAVYSATTFQTEGQDTLDLLISG